MDSVGSQATYCGLRIQGLRTGSVPISPKPSNLNRILTFLSLSPTPISSNDPQSQPLLSPLITLKSNTPLYNPLYKLGVQTPNST